MPRELVQTIFAENNLTLCFTPSPSQNVTCLPRARRRCPVSSLETSRVLTSSPLNLILTLFFTKNSLDTPPNDSEEIRVRGENTPARPRKRQIRPAISSNSSSADEYSDEESGKIMGKKLVCEDSMKELKSVLQVICSKAEKNEKSLKELRARFNNYDIVINI